MRAKKAMDMAETSMTRCKKNLEELIEKQKRIWAAGGVDDPIRSLTKRSLTK